MSLQHVSSRIGIARGDRRALRRCKTRRPRPLRRATHRSAAPTFRAHGSSVPRRRLQVCHRNAAYYPWLAGVVAPRTTVARPQALNTPCANSGTARRVDGGVGLAACYPPGGWAAGRLGGWAAGRLGGWAAGRLGGAPSDVCNASKKNALLMGAPFPEITLITSEATTPPTMAHTGASSASACRPTCSSQTGDTAPAGRGETHYAAGRLAPGPATLTHCARGRPAGGQCTRATKLALSHASGRCASPSFCCRRCSSQASRASSVLVALPAGPSRCSCQERAHGAGRGCGCGHAWLRTRRTRGGAGGGGRGGGRGGGAAACRSQRSWSAQ